jgi:hypothetical protein
MGEAYNWWAIDANDPLLGSVEYAVIFYRLNPRS